jgi:hypothetical protein
MNGSMIFMCMTIGVVSGINLTFNKLFGLAFGEHMPVASVLLLLYTIAGAITMIVCLNLLMKIFK